MTKDYLLEWEFCMNFYQTNFFFVSPLSKGPDANLRLGILTVIIFVYVRRKDKHQSEVQDLSQNFPQCDPGRLLLVQVTTVTAIPGYSNLILT